MSWVMITIVAMVTALSCACIMKPHAYGENIRLMAAGGTALMGAMLGAILGLSLL